MNSIESLFQPTCWRCWNRITGKNFRTATHPFKVLIPIYIRNYSQVFIMWRRSKGIYTCGVNSQFRTLYKCPICGYDRWTLSSVYFPRIFLLNKITKDLADTSIQLTHILMDNLDVLLGK